ncbi:oligosaccharide flippase family protein [Pseudomonas umsongensis]|jgi:O-antigen/teichoic acid export membrane protein|uniref:Oligosaccharide flippase family protein n=1 Tax=Pseudomonas umsongensis TaxID=198618 RepID=A0AAE6ZWT7_9PSED|nr:MULTISPECIES: oligosaccharide flippase family protein [Pseudomonas]KEX95211.1 polysaccharide biosynthesis protein [Pseudomonas putida]MBT9574695.1 oligosaccharide flippase family protein [Pseudomonas umsongensis]OXR35755.1 polysaccharide biosynthesis protein [Pseudomonas umsongensis]QFG30980.1 oligosaccharide flippase family protein [Pseudomonas umsongensis]QJC80200.1 oligosaccharide flippase family protein [Pseudomonas umsongensis]
MPSVNISPTFSLRRRAISAGAWNLGALVTSQVIRLGGNLVMTRLLMPEMFGIIAIATTVLFVLHLLSDVGLRQNILQSPRGDDPVFLNTLWTVQIVRGFVLFAFTLLLAAAAWYSQVIDFWSHNSTYAAPELPMVLAWTGVTAIIYGFQSTKVDLAVRAFQQKKVVIAEFVSQVVGLLVMLVIGYFTHSIWSLVAAGLVTALVSTLLGHFWFEGPSNSLRWERAALHELMVFGRWILLSSAVGVLSMQGDRIIFGGSMTVFEMGVYSIAVLILGALQTGVLKVVGAVALPAFGEAARTNDFERLRSLYYRFKMMVDVALLFLCGFLWVTSPLIIKVLYDDRYAQAGHMMAVLSTSFFVMRYIVANQIWIALGLTKYQAIDNIIRVVSLWVLVPLLLAFGGVDWAIWGVALHTLPTLVLVVYVNRRVGILDIKRELIVLPMLVVGALCGELVLVVFKWLFDLSA